MSKLHNPDQRVDLVEEEKHRLNFSRSVQKRIEAQAGEKFYTQAELNEKLAGLREANAAICDEEAHLQEINASQAVTTAERDGLKLVAFVASQLAQRIRQLPNEHADAGVRAIEERVRKHSEHDSCDCCLQNGRDEMLSAILSGDTSGLPDVFRERTVEGIQAIERRVLERVAAACDDEGYIHRSEILALKGK